MMRQNLWMVYLSSINNNNEAFLQTDGLLTLFQGIVIGNKPPSTERLCRILPTLLRSLLWSDPASRLAPPTWLISSYLLQTGAELHQIHA